MDREGVIEERRTDEKWEGSYGLAVLYTIGYLGIMFFLMMHEIPSGNRELLLTLIGIMSAAQLGIIKYFYDGTKGAETAQTAGMIQASRAFGTVQDIAKTAPNVAAAVVAAAVPPNGKGTIVADTVQVDAQTANVTGEVKP